MQGVDHSGCYGFSVSVCTCVCMCVAIVFFKDVMLALVVDLKE